MKRKLFDWYQYVAPALLTPLSFWLWWQEYSGNLYLLLVAWLLPILYAYIVPAVGTNVLKVWEFDTRLRLGRFRPHHGFVFGSATSMLAWACHIKSANGLVDVLAYTFMLALLLAVVNVFYDIHAIKSGLLKVYNQPWAEGKDATAIVLDYALWFFGGFGIVYGLAITGAEWWSQQGGIDLSLYLIFLLSALLACLVLPVIGYRYQSLRRHGHSGCFPVAALSPDTKQ